MKAITIQDGRYAFRSLPVPSPGPGEILIRVAAAGMNRADLFQLDGKYPLPDNDPPVPGLEVSGHVAAAGEGVSGWEVGAPVCALLREGGYAEYALANAEHCLPVPQGVDMIDAAGLPEACFTVWLALKELAGLSAEETVLIHGGASGIGSMAIQIARLLGATPLATAGSEEKRTLCRHLGTALAVSYRDDFAAQMLAFTEGRGVDVILDLAGGESIPANFRASASQGRIIQIAFLEGAKTSGSLGALLTKQLRWQGMTLRSRSNAEKAAFAAALRQEVWPHFASGALRPVIDRRFPLAEADKALACFREGQHSGKILLVMGEC